MNKSYLIVFSTVLAAVSTPCLSYCIENIANACDQYNMYELKRHSVSYAVRKLCGDNGEFYSILTPDELARYFAIDDRMQIGAKRLSEEVEYIISIVSRMSPELALSLENIAKKYFAKDSRSLLIFSVILETSALEIAYSVIENARKGLYNDNLCLTYYYPARLWCAEAKIEDVVSLIRDTARTLLQMAENNDKDTMQYNEAINYAKGTLFSSLDSQKYIEQSLMRIKSLIDGYKENNSSINDFFKETVEYQNFLSFEQKFNSNIIQALSYPKTFLYAIPYEVHYRNRLIPNNIVALDDKYDYVKECSELFSLLTNNDIWDGKLESLYKAVSNYTYDKYNELLYGYKDILTYLGDKANIDSIYNDLKEITGERHFSAYRRMRFASKASKLLEFVAQSQQVKTKNSQVDESKVASLSKGKKRHRGISKIFRVFKKSK